MTWGSWECLCFLLANSLSDTINLGWVPKNKYGHFINCIKWCNEFLIEYGEDEISIPPMCNNEDLCQLKSVPKNEISCLEQDIFISMFAINEMFGVYSLNEKDRKILTPVLTYIEKLLPWIKWQQ